MLNQGIRLSGESQEFFIRGRIASLQRRLPRDFNAERILDFGCGTGVATRHLAEQFPSAYILGVDTSTKALEYGRKEWGSSRIQFRKLQELDSENTFDLCYVNGVFHHIAVPERAGAVTRIHAALRTGGRLALFENNPWNPGARMVMKRIPFDRDAQMLSIRETTRLIRCNGFASQITNWSLFYYPRALSFLRWSENALSHLPLGAQYCVYAVK